MIAALVTGYLAPIVAGVVGPDVSASPDYLVAARPLEAGPTLSVDLAGQDLLSAVRATPAHEYLLAREDGSPAGILAVAGLARTRQEPT